jgi:5-methylcytosine-specific restriction endonuclease McrA
MIQSLMNMFRTNLSRRFDYSLRGLAYRPTIAERKDIYSPSVRKEDWNHSTYKQYKSTLKQKHYYGQNLRCAYCRVRLRIDAYYDELDHIVPQSDRGNWIFYPKNLVVACKPCNSLKNADKILTNPSQSRFPLFSAGFLVFNPHFDRWADHFEIHKGIFLRGKPGTKGPKTYEVCHLFRYHIVLEYSEELRYRNKRTLRRLTHLLRDPSLSNKQIAEIQKAIFHLLRIARP